MKSKRDKAQEKMQAEIKAKIAEGENNTESSSSRFQPRDYWVTVIVGMICLAMLIFGSTL